MLKVYSMPKSTLKIYCQGCWLILKDIETIFLKKLTCGYAVVFYIMMIVLHM